MKVVINRCFGGFSLSGAAFEFIERWLKRNGGCTPDIWKEIDYCDPVYRNRAELVECVESLGHAADGPHANLKVVEIPDDIKWGISNYDGLESVHERHRVWF